MEIERKFLVSVLPEDYDHHSSHQIEQAYLSTDPVVRIRKEDDQYYLTYKSRGLLAREEYNLPLNQASYEHLLTKADGIVLTKQRSSRFQAPPAQRSLISFPATTKD